MVTTRRRRKTLSKEPKKKKKDKQPEESSSSTENDNAREENESFPVVEKRAAASKDYSSPPPDNDPNDETDGGGEGEEEKDVEDYVKEVENQQEEEEDDDDDDDDDADDNDNEDNDDDDDDESVKQDRIVDKPHKDDQDKTMSSSLTPLQKTRSKQKSDQRQRPLAHSKEIGNGLSALIPGYTAPLQLETSTTLDRYRVGMSELRRRATETDSSTRGLLYDPLQTNKSTSSNSKPTGFMPTNYAKAVSFRYGVSQQGEGGAGAKWFHMQPSVLTENVKMDMAVIRNRNYLDPKRFYKSSDAFGKVVQVGTVVEGAAEYYSSRLTRKERRTNLTEELLADPEASGYAKRKFQQFSRDQTARAKQRQWGGGKRKRRDGKLSKSARRGY